MPSAAWEHLARHNFSQNELARRLNITSGYLSLLVTGKRSPSPELRRRILALLPGTTFDQMFLVEAPEPQPAVRHKPRWMQAIGAALLAVLLTLGAWFLRPGSGERAVAPVRSLAVMTFRVEAEDARARDLARGLPEDLGAALSRIGLSVAARRSVLELAGAADPRSVGAQLGVDAVLEGSVRSYGSKLKVHIELVSTRTGFQVWSQTFTTEAEDLLGAEEKTAGEIAARLRAALTTPK